ncbi:glycoside hydrolase family 16 protein [Methylobacterium sp. E-005]|uniref:glycoside hydrolase family 16 protein n=1 Tax=Methylobacterium sp. E-005 TaxID=2836549 RepID=UPI001FB95250|nr:glycoside hydrolase family 16 protein [Methylobacterium sp. E-005]MCJ2089599.1 glycoside hydrolase family 16 protein [Methylobacterium sp. E-005]
MLAQIASQAISKIFLISLIFVGASVVPGVCEEQAHLLADGESLELKNMELTFEDNFTKPSVVARPPFSNYNSNAKWLAHTPWNGDFGEARFMDPGPDGPFEFSEKGLKIIARKSTAGQWTSGLICSVDRDGPGQQGFTQKYGYFELRAKLPEGEGAWPAFWLVGSDKSNGSTEIDVLEYYGQFNAGFHTVIHLWKKEAPKHEGYVVDVPPKSLTDTYHTYGVLIDETRTKFYLDRREYLNIPTPDEFRQPMYILVNFALGGGWPIDKMISPAEMSVQYVRAYRQRSH